MNEMLFPYYERELVFIRQLLQEFAKRHPGAAGRLLLEPNRSADPQVERLIESFALLTGRVQHKLDDEFPEISTPILQAIYPHFLAPIPSMGIVELELDPVLGQLPTGFHVPRRSQMRTEPVDGLPCRFRTTYSTTLWPIQLAGATFQAPPFPRGVVGPPGAGAALLLQFECLGAMKFADLAIDRLRLFLHGDLQVVPELYEFLNNNVLQVDFQPGEPGSTSFSLSPHDALASVGFEQDESLLPYALPSRLGYRLLTELFVFPAKFWFIDLGGWQQVRGRGYQRRCDVVIYFDRTLKLLERSVDAGTFRLGCTPIVNLFEQTAERIDLQGAQFEYPVVPDAAHPRGMEVYGVDAVASPSPADRTPLEFEPFFSIRHPRKPDQAEVFWFLSRWGSLAEQDPGTQVNLHLVGLDSVPKTMARPSLEVKTTCTNRNLPNLLRMSGTGIAFESESAGPYRIHSLLPLTPPLRPRHRAGRYWHLVSHLSLNFLSLADDKKGREALQEILGLYDFSDPEAGQQQLAAVTRQFIEGITAVKSRRVIGRLTREKLSGFCRGLEVEIAFDEDKYPGVGAFLFASVLERFFGLYVSSHSFTQLVARGTRQADPIKIWPPRSGELPSL